MEISRRHPVAGRPLRWGNFPMVEDPETYNTGFKIGYLKDGEPVVLPIKIAVEMIDELQWKVNRYRERVAYLKPRIPIKQRLASWLYEKVK